MTIGNNSGFKESRKSFKTYFDWRKKRAVEAVLNLEKFQSPKGKKVLDIGCGYGSLLSAIADKGGRGVGVEVDAESVKIAGKFLKGNKNLKIFQVEAGKLPLEDNFFDIVFLFDVIEHAKQPLKLLRETVRVLKPGGFLYVEFTPYCCLIGHHLYDITWFPIHIFPKNAVKWIVNTYKPKGIFKDYWQTFKSLNKLKIYEVQHETSSLVKMEEKFLLKYPDRFEVNLPFLNYLGPFKDLFTFSFIGTYRK